MAGSVPQAWSDGKLAILQTWSGKITAQVRTPGLKETHYSSSIIHFKELQTTFESTFARLVDQLDISSG